MLTGQLAARSLSPSDSGFLDTCQGWICATQKYKLVEDALLHYRKTVLCRVLGSLPSAKHKKLGEISAHGISRVCQVSALGKEEAHIVTSLCQVPEARTRQNRRTCTTRAPTVRRPWDGLAVLSTLCHVQNGRHSA